MNRRHFIKQSALAGASLGLAGSLSACRSRLSEEAALQEAQRPGPLFFKLSLAQWSLHRTFWSGELDNLDFAATARELGIGAVEYVNQFFIDKAKDQAYLREMKQRADDQGVANVLIMVDMEGSLAGSDEAARLQAVENHYQWIEAARFLGCHAIRVNAAGKGEGDAVAARAVDSLGRLATYAAQENMNVLVENHGGYSSDAAWLASVIRQVGMDNCGSLPDFGNFTLSLFPYRRYDTYEGMQTLMPLAKGVSAKSHDFDAEGNDVRVDFRRILQIVRDAGYTGHIGIEYEGYRLSEKAGIMATRKLLERAGAALT